MYVGISLFSTLTIPTDLHNDISCLKFKYVIESIAYDSEITEALKLILTLIILVNTFPSK